MKQLQIYQHTDQKISFFSQRTKNLFKFACQMCELHNQQAFSSHYHTKMVEEESYPQHPVYEKNTIEFVTVAAEYCAFIENCGVYTSKAFFEKCVKLASLLYLKSALLPEMDENGFSDLQQYVTENTYMDIQEAI